jgi:hypothetical protein
VICGYRTQLRISRSKDIMIKRIIGLPNCMKGRHERSERHITPDGDTYVSRCAHCGVRLRRRAKRDWVVDRA